MKNFMLTLGVAAMAFAGCAQNQDTGKPAIDMANFDNTVSAKDLPDSLWPLEAAVPQKLSQQVQ